MEEEKIKLIVDTQDLPADQDAPEKTETAAPEEDPSEQTLKETIQVIKETATEEDVRPTGQLTLRSILGGDLLSTQLVRSQIGLFLLIVAFTIVYVAFRYQCQQDMIQIDKLEGELKHAKYKALSSSSTLTAKSRESHILELLKQNQDSLLHQADQPPYIIEIPE